MLLSQLKYFQVVARHQHISRAAEELCVAQPAISATISKLEKELGVPLFDRQGRNIALNYAGSRLLAHTDFIFAQLEALEQALERTHQLQENEFTLSVSNSMFLNGWLQHFVLQNPNLRLRQKMLSEAQMLQALQEETIDVALGEFEQDHPGIVREVIIDDEYVVAIPSNNALTRKEQIYFEDIRQEDIIALPSNTIFKIADRLFAQRDCKPNIAFEGNQRMMRKALKLNRGLLFATRQMIYMPYWYQIVHLGHSDIREAYAEGTIRTIEDLNCRCKLCLCWKQDRELPLMARKFIEAMRYDYPKYSNDKEFMENTTAIFPIST